MSMLEDADPQVARIIQAERRRQTETLELIASENHASAAVMEATGSILTDKYAEGYPHKRWYCGCENADDIEQLAIQRARELFGAEYANVQPHSGTTANLAVYLAAVKPGGKLMAMRLDHGGHLSHGLPINLSGQTYEVVQYGVDTETERLDLDAIRKQALEERPDLLIVGASAYPRAIDFEALGGIAEEAGCAMLADVAHIAGLIVGGVHPAPLPWADFVTTTTHKTLRGPRGGMILCRRTWARKIDAAIFPGLQGGPLMHAIAAKAVAFGEALQPSFRDYARQVVENARALAGELGERGWRLVSGGTDTHLLLVDLRCFSEELTGRDAAGWLNRAGLVANKNAIPFDPRGPREASGIRLGTPAVTTRGMGPDEMTRIASWVDHVLRSGGDTETLDRVRADVRELCGRFRIPDRRGRAAETSEV